MTLKANELRIGNYVSDIHAVGTFYAEVKKLDFSRCYYGKFNSDYSDLKPIPLTEEWLFKFGFLKDLENDIFLNINAYAFLYWQNNKVELLDNDNNFMISHCDYVHQLQNLYFALTAKELTFKSEL